jgi:hypothetical protein
VSIAQSELVREAVDFLRAGPDTERRAGVLAEHGVAALVGALSPGLSDAERAALRDAIAPFAVASLRAQATLERVSPALTAAGSPHVVFKGPALQSLWVSALGVDTRLFTDVDVLISPRFRAAARTALLAIDMRLGPGGPGEEAYWAPDGGVLDLHWLLLNDVGLSQRFRLDTDEVLSTHVHWEGAVGTLDPVTTLLHTAAHAVISDLAKLSAMVDVYVAASAPELDWTVLVEAADTRSLGLITATALLRIQTLLPLEVPRHVLRSLGSATPWGRLATLAARRRPVDYLGARWSGGELYRHTRENTRRSVASLLASVGPNVRVQRHLVRSRTAGAP